MTFKTTAISLEDSKTLLLAHGPSIFEYIALLYMAKFGPYLLISHVHVTNYRGVNGVFLGLQKRRKGIMLKITNGNAKLMVAKHVV